MRHELGGYICMPADTGLISKIHRQPEAPQDNCVFVLPKIGFFNDQDTKETVVFGL